MADKNPGFFDSDDEDDDFVPQDESDDAIEPDEEENDNASAQNKGKKNSKKNTSRRRKGGLYLSDEEPAEENESTNMEPKDDTQDPTSTDGKSDLHIDNNNNTNNTNPLTTSNPDPSPANDAAMSDNPSNNNASDNSKKRKLDDLWAELNKPVAKKKAPPKTVLPWAFGPATPKANSTATASNDNTTATNSEVASVATEKKEVTINASEILGLSTSEEKKVTITQTFNFAGEEVKVTKEVDAKNVPIVKGSKGLESVLSKIKGQKKMTSTQKSALDWNQFKEKEGIEQELQHAAKDGYLEKVAFMERTDLRQFEKEKELRDEMRKVNAKKQSK